MIFESDCLLNISVSNNLVKNYLQCTAPLSTYSRVSASRDNFYGSSGMYATSDMFWFYCVGSRLPSYQQYYRWYTKAEVKSVCIGVETGRCNTRTFFQFPILAGHSQKLSTHEITSDWNSCIHSINLCQDIKFLAPVFGFTELVYGPFVQSNATYGFKLFDADDVCHPDIWGQMFDFKTFNVKDI